MIRLTSYNSKYTLPAILLSCLPFLFSCSETEVSGKLEESSTPVRVSAGMAQYAQSRAYLEQGMVTSGQFYLSFPDNPTNEYLTVADVNFGLPGVTEGIGIVTLPSNEPMMWQNVGGGSQPVFYLDNVTPSLLDDDSDAMTVIFDSDNPFKASLFDSEEGTNDLLWGSLGSTRDANTLNFDLHHNMARLILEVTVDKTNEKFEGELNLEGAKVTLSSIITTPFSYNRIDGTFSYGENPQYETFVLVSPDDPELGWVGSQQDPDNENITVYTSQDFVIPPQTLQEYSDNRRLTITLASDKVYTGVIPYAMNVIDSNHPAPGYPMALSFLKEHVLTIRTLVSEEPPELVLMPVQVVEWVDKGEFFLDAHQAGIYTATEFYDLIKNYNKDTETRQYQLQRYGSYDSETNTWNFGLWYTITLDYNEIYNKMKPGDGKPEFTFTFNGFRVYVQPPTGDPYAVDEIQLYNILKGE